MCYYGIFNINNIYVFIIYGDNKYRLEFFIKLNVLKIIK